ncbi:Imm1 family immunity protein [Brevibacillus sp. H7]|jgi:hypothetical protein|uniref:Imm1 family immunity protein n=1 Tax=Brevibacillus sp. H7 TaxID=3349138 RepID=UPI0037FF0AE3
MLNDWLLYTDASGTQRENTAWHEVLRAIAQLNGTTHTLVHAAFGEHGDLVVAGGNNGQVLVQWKEHEPSEKHYVLTSDKPSAVMVRLTIEGEEAAFPANWCVPLEKAIPLCGDILRTCEIGPAEEFVWLEVKR